MAMKYVAAYLMCMFGNENSGKKEVKSVLEAVNANVEDDVLDHFLDSVKGKNYYELISEGLKKLQNVGNAAASAPAVTSDETVDVKTEDKKEEKKEEEEEEDDLGFSLFG